MAGNDTSQCALLGRHTPRRRYIINVLRRSCGKVAVSSSLRLPSFAAERCAASLGAAWLDSPVELGLGAVCTGATAWAGSDAGTDGTRAPAAVKKLCIVRCRFGMIALGTSMDQRCRVRRTLYEGRWATVTQSGISAPLFVRYPGPNFSTVATHRFRSAVRALVASLTSRRAFGCDASSSPNLTAVTRSARKS